MLASFWTSDNFGTLVLVVLIFLGWFIGRTYRHREDMAKIKYGAKVRVPAPPADLVEPQQPPQ